MVLTRMKSITGFSNDVIGINLPGDNRSDHSIKFNFNASELIVNVERIQPPLLKIKIPKTTPLGIYSIPLIVTIREPSEATITKPISIESLEGKVDPEFGISRVSYRGLFN